MHGMYVRLERWNARKAASADAMAEALLRITTIDMGKGRLAFEAAQNIALMALATHRSQP
jgi:hypothetical protein